MARLDSGTLKALTGLRGVAALWVLLHHLSNQAASLGLPGVFQNTIFAHGWIAVDLFFILSGFMLMHVHGRDFERLTLSGLRRFALQRFLRVYPLATIVLGLIGLLVICDPAFVATERLLHDGRDFAGPAFLRTLALATRWIPGEGESNEPVWSLSCELVGYAAFPFLAGLLLAVRRAELALALAALCIGSLVYGAAITDRLDANDIGSWGLVRMAYGFVSGMALAHAFHLMDRPHIAWAGALVFVATIALGVACTGLGLMILAMPACALLIFGLAFEQGFIGAFLSWGPILWLGRISFPLYLVHVVPLFWIEVLVTREPSYRPDSLAMVGVYLVFCLGLAHLLHVAIERPMHALARRSRHCEPEAKQSSGRKTDAFAPGSLRLRLAMTENALSQQIPADRYGERP